MYLFCSCSLFSIASGINEESDVCMNDCNCEGEREATQYELMYCDPVNLGTLY